MAASAQAVRRIAPLTVGRYTLHEMIGAGGMAAVYLGRLRAGNGFLRTVAIKRLHPQLALDAEFVDMFITEARLAARIRHPNVVATLDVVHDGPDVLLVMDYVQGESLAAILRRLRQQEQSVPFDIASGLFCGVLAGLQAAHTATHDDGSPLSVVHRDVSPENILLGADGVPRVLDFGVAKAAGMSSVTKEGTVKGKLAYMAPEQLLAQPVTPCTDLFALGTVMWESLTGRRAFKGDNDGETVNRVLLEPIPSPSAHRPDIPPALEQVILKALRREVSERYQSAEEMHRALEDAVPPATSRRIAEWLKEVARESLAEKALKVSAMEGSGPGETDGFIPVEHDRTELDVSSASMAGPPRSRYLPFVVLLLVVGGVGVGAGALMYGRRTGDVPSLPSTNTIQPTAVLSTPAPPPPSVEPLPTPASPTADPRPTGSRGVPRLLPTAKKVPPKPTSTSLYSRD